ncbi:transposase [Promicromonospora soli]
MAQHDGDHNHLTRYVESRLPGDGHGRFGERAGETDRRKRRHRAPARFHSETLTVVQRAGNAGSNTAADHHTVLDEVLDQLPDENKHSKILIRIDGAGASHETIERILAANHKRRRVAFTIGWTITPAEEAAIVALPEQTWTAYLRQDGTPASVTDPDGDEVGYGHVAEITDLPRREGWPGDLRLIVRRVPITDRDRAAGKLTRLEQRTGWKYAITATNIVRMRGIPGTHHPQWLDVLHRHHAVVEDRVRVAKQTGLGHLPSASWRVNTAWTLLAATAADLDAWTRLLGFHDHELLTHAEPATMREIVYRLPARLARTRWLRFDRDHPHTTAITTAWHRLAALATT